MATIIKLRIDVTKIDKALLFKGAKGTYLDATLFLEEEDDQYDQCGRISQDVSKAAREAGEKGAILGNAKRLVKKAAPQQDTRRESRSAPAQRQAPPATRQPDVDDESSNIPF